MYDRPITYYKYTKLKFIYHVKLADPENPVFGGSDIVKAELCL